MEFMKSIGIFILCTQSFMHFAAGKSYEKYVKLLIGVMILAQFIVPVRAVFLGGEDARIWEEIERFQQELEAVALEMDADVAIAMNQDGVEKKALEEEIKERLTDTAGSYGMTIEEVQVKEEPPKVTVMIYQKVEENNAGRIKVEKITIGGKGQEETEKISEATGDMIQELSTAFSRALGVNADYVEVIVR